MKGFAHTDKPAENYHLILQIPAVLQSAWVLLSIGFSGLATSLFWLGLTALINLISNSRQLFPAQNKKEKEKKKTNLEKTLPGTKMVQKQG